MLKSLAREPLVHFLIAGAVLFAVFHIVSGPEPEAEDSATITVDRAALLGFMQYRANAFEPGAFGSLLDSMNADELQAVVDAYVEEEALYREAAALGLEQNDYVIRQRMIQKMEFLLGDLAEAGEEIDEGELAGYFADNAQAYAIEPSVTFTHVFFDPQRRGAEAEADAREAARARTEAGTGFNSATGGGDHFPFLRNYVDRTLDYVASHFGEAFAAELARMEPGETAWAAPVRSAYGEHAVLLTRRTERRIPELDEVRAQVTEDFIRDRADASLAETKAAVVERYEVEMALEPARE